jgi:anti-sigma factor RsiW
MEPTDLKPIPPDDAELEAWLRASAALPSVPDHGFTQRVLTALPARAARRSAQRSWFCAGGALVGIVVAILGALSSGSLPASLPALEETMLGPLARLSVADFGLALGVTLLSLSFAFRDRLRLLPRW